VIHLAGVVVMARRSHSLSADPVIVVKELFRAS